MLVAAFDFPNICRICLDKGDLKPLDENTIELIEIITDVNVKSESDFPKNICSKCIKDLMDISMFMDKMKYNNMLLKFVLLNPQITIKQEPLEEMFCINRIEVNKTEPANTIEQTSILRNLLNYENFQKEDRQQNSVSTGYKFDKNNVKSFKENSYCVCSKMQCTECEHDPDFDTQPTQPLEKKLKIFNSPRKPELRKFKIKKLKLEEYKYKPEPKETLFGCRPTRLKCFLTNTTLKEDMSKHNMTLNWLESQKSVGTMSLKNKKFESLISITPKSETKHEMVKIIPKQKESLNGHENLATKFHWTAKPEIGADQNLFESEGNFNLFIESQLIKEIIDNEFPT